MTKQEKDIIYRALGEAYKDYCETLDMKEFAAWNAIYLLCLELGFNRSDIEEAQRFDSLTRCFD